MGRRKDLSKFERGMIVGARLLGAPVSQTSVLSGKSKTTVSRVFTEWRKSQKTTTDRSRCGRKRLVTDSVRQWLEKIVTSERTMTIAAITQTLNAGSDETVSARTVRRELRRMGFYCRVQLQKHNSLDLKDKKETKDDKENGKKLADENGENGGSDEEYPREVKDGEEEEGDEGLDGEKEDEDEVEEVEEDEDDDDEDEEEQPLPAAAHPAKRRGNEQETVGKKRQKTASGVS
ncbi:YTH domain-containing protein 1-like isoform X1 [Polyodon spathula]|uniref:YTH domain-containing protein 1-like isoform X1 n=1 Tax=Polyodon spathula TaxID=7913 RepID=UPI001B7E8A4E|nr:YTH domain-containing protein 1-like isoform X1 [Polyodon spathula]